MAKVTFDIDDDVLEKFEKNVPFEQQSIYINDLLAKSILDDNQRQIEHLIWNFAKENPAQHPTTTLTGVEIIRQLREGDARA